VIATGGRVYQTAVVTPLAKGLIGRSPRREDAMSIGRQLSVVGFMLALAALDFVGALVAQDLADRRRMSSLLLGSALSITLFVVYAVALRLADLSIVTMGWIVMLQVAVIAWDVVRRGLQLNPVQWAAITLIIVLQIFLTATTQGRADRPGTTAAYEMTRPGGAQTSTAVVTPGRSPVTR
jgi:hypothetical protein